MKRLFIFLIIILSIKTTAQDFDLYKKDRNDNYKLPDIDKSMTADEFLILSENIRMKHMLYATIVPGYIHFRIKEKKKGYWLLGIRSASYFTMGYILLDGKNDFFRLDFNDLDEEDLNKAKKSQNIFYTALSIAAATYAYDVIHGDWVLHQKQEKIRYKYALKAQVNTTGYLLNSKPYPALALTLDF